MQGEPDPRRVAVGRLVAYLLRSGWRPPPLTEVLVDRIAADFEREERRLERAREQGATHETGLTERQARILELAAQGLTYAEIGAELAIMPGTVKEHVRRVLGRLGARNMTHAVALAIAAGAIVPPEL